MADNQHAVLAARARAILDRRIAAGARLTISPEASGDWLAKIEEMNDGQKSGHVVSAKTRDDAIIALAWGLDEEGMSGG